MFKFLALLLLFVIFGFLFLGVFLGRVIRFFTGGGSGNTNRRQTTDRESQPSQSAEPQKKFPKDEGEYVSYEEIKEEDKKP